jgi:murein DD-endopeptidase MepM/ murein hydrolase activator NlpD
MEPAMTVRNDVPFFTQASKKIMPRHRSVLMRLGCCLGGIGVFGSTIVQAQTPLASSVVIPTGATVEQALQAVPEPVATPATTDAPVEPVEPGTASTRAADLQPERILEVESADSQAGMPAADLPVLEVPDVATEVAPRQATGGPAAGGPADSEGYAAPTAVVVSDRSSPATKTTKPAATKPAPPSAPPQSKVSQQPPKLAAPAAIGAEPPAIAAPVAPVGESAPAVRLGPISFSSAGISISPSAVQPYFDAKKLPYPKLPALQDLRLMFPVAIPAPITSLFGWRVHPITGSQRMHTGTDIGAPMGAPVLAALAGRVILADMMGGYGIAVALEHENGTRQTLYAHLSELFVRPGDVIQQGTVIGRVGSTGASTGPHLHFELRQMLPDGTWVAQDAGHSLELAMSSLVQSLQVAQQPQPPIASRVMPTGQAANYAQSDYPAVKSVR